jgi:ribosomal-protein-alanine N-acetyltransferase
VRTATAADIDAMVRIASLSPEAPQWDAEHLLGMLGSRTPDSTVCRALLVAESDQADLTDGIAGFAVAAALCVVYPAEADLESLAVAPQFRGKGCARALLEASRRWAAAEGSNVLRLEVRASNARALDLYRRAGFEETGVRRGYYRMPAEDAVCMALKIPDEIARDIPQG